MGRPASTDEGVSDALVRLYRRVESAQALFKGHVLMGHRASISAGSMYWALPGRAHAHTSTLRTEDPGFRVLSEPDSGWLVNAAARAKKLESNHV
jgi:hypothetical protein